jgi:hypothetical protein
MSNPSLKSLGLVLVKVPKLSTMERKHANDWLRTAATSTPHFVWTEDGDIVVRRAAADRMHERLGEAVLYAARAGHPGNAA